MRAVAMETGGHDSAASAAAVPFGGGGSRAGGGIGGGGFETLQMECVKTDRLKDGAAFSFLLQRFYSPAINSYLATKNVMNHWFGADFFFFLIL